MVFFLDETINEIVDTRKERFWGGLSISVDNVIFYLAGALEATEWDLFDGFIKFAFAGVEKSFEELNQLLFLKWR